MPGDIRDDLAQAIEKASGTAADTGSTESASSAESSAGDANRVSTEKSAVSVGTKEASQAVKETRDDSASSQSDAAGDTQATPAKQGTQQADASAQSGQALRPPVSWKPEARETFASLPPLAQQEVLRREREIDRALQESAGARKFSEEFNQAISPFQHLIAAENSTPINAVRNLMQTAAALRTSPPLQRAQLVAQIIGQYGVDIQMLDNVLSAAMQGKAPAQQPQVDPSVAHLEQRIAPVIDFVSSLQQRQQQAQQTQQQAMQQEIEQFASDPSNEFFHDVQADMADILEVAARRNQKMSLRDAYDRATMLHPTISQIVERRRLTQGAAQQSAAAERAAAAGASLPSGQAPSKNGIDGDDGSIRSALEAAITRTSRRV